MSLDINDKMLFKEAFNLLCGELLGIGIHRKTFKCRIDPGLVVKVEYDTDWFVGANAAEWRNWEFNSDYKKVSDWLAPCAWISPNGRIMLQHRTAPLGPKDYPDKVPAFFTDIKPENWGWYGGRPVCHDYPQLITPANTRLKNVKDEWAR